MKNLLFDNIDRQIILDFYKKNPNGNWNNTPFVVTRFEITKSKKEFQKQIEKTVFPILDFILKITTKSKK